MQELVLYPLTISGPPLSGPVLPFGSSGRNPLVEGKYKVMLDSSGVYVRTKFQYNPSKDLSAITRGKTQIYKQYDTLSLLLIGNKANK